MKAPDTDAAPARPTPPPGSGSGRLDEVVHVTRPRQWWALTATALAVAAVVVWSLTATVPRQITAAGAVDGASRVTMLASSADGSVRFSAAVGETVARGDVVAVVTPFDGSAAVSLRAAADGMVQAQQVADGTGVMRGDEVAQLLNEEPSGADHILVTYVAAADAVRVRTGTRAQVTFTDFDRDVTHAAEATVKEVATVPSTPDGMSVQLGSAAFADDLFDAVGPLPHRVVLALPSTDTAGHAITIVPGQEVRAVFTYAHIHPVDFLFGGAS